MRMMIGAGFGGIGLMGLMLGFMLEAGEATTSLLYALAAAYAFMLATLLSANQKGHLHEIRKPPGHFPGHVGSLHPWCCALNGSPL